MSNYKTVSRNDVKVVVSKIESLAKDLQTKLVSGEAITSDPAKSPILSLSSEIVRNASVLAFSLGELTATELTTTTTTTTTKTVPITPVGATAVQTPKRLNYHNKRDARGRFTV